MMWKWIQRTIVALAVVMSTAVGISVADYALTAGSGTTIFAFTCSGKQCLSHVPIKSDGTELFTSSNPGVISGSISTQAATTGGVTAYTPFVPTAGDNHQTVKNGAGTAYWMAVSNNSATKNYARLYDAGTGFNACNSATGVIFAFEIPPSDGGFTILLGGNNGISFSTGLSLCITSGFGLTDTTAATASAMYVNVGYK